MDSLIETGTGKVNSQSPLTAWGNLQTSPFNREGQNTTPCKFEMNGTMKLSSLDFTVQANKLVHNQNQNQKMLKFAIENSMKMKVSSLYRNLDQQMEITQNLNQNQNNMFLKTLTLMSKDRQRQGSCDKGSLDLQNGVKVGNVSPMNQSSLYNSVCENSIIDFAISKEQQNVQTPFGFGNQISIDTPLHQNPGSQFQNGVFTYKKLEQNKTPLKKMLDKLQEAYDFIGGQRHIAQSKSPEPSQVNVKAAIRYTSDTIQKAKINVIRQNKIYQRLLRKDIRVPDSDFDINPELNNIRFFKTRQQKRQRNQKKTQSISQPPQPDLEHTSKSPFQQIQKDNKQHFMFSFDLPRQSEQTHLNKTSLGIWPERCFSKFNKRNQSIQGGRSNEHTSHAQKRRSSLSPLTLTQIRNQSNGQNSHNESLIQSQMAKRPIDKSRQLKLIGESYQQANSSLATTNQEQKRRTVYRLSPRAQTTQNIRHNKVANVSSQDHFGSRKPSVQSKKQEVSPIHITQFQLNFKKIGNDEKSIADISENTNFRPLPIFHSQKQSGNILQLDLTSKNSNQIKIPQTNLKMEQVKDYEELVVVSPTNANYTLRDNPSPKFNKIFKNNNKKHENSDLTGWLSRTNERNLNAGGVHNNGTDSPSIMKQSSNTQSFNQYAGQQSQQSNYSPLKH